MSSFSHCVFKFLCTFTLDESNLIQIKHYTEFWVLSEYVTISYKRKNQLQTPSCKDRSTDLEKVDCSICVRYHCGPRH